ncbi:MAG TPA: hypothetical protein VM692_02130 [Gammaproteobacteria bacterium]|nr:hypothetical protein [Gammaproteobacteria bacterium]
MTSRREFLKVGLAAAALPAAAQTELADEGTPTVALYKVLYDTRFPASVAFGRRASARGLVVQAMAGDMTGFWYDDLYHRWRNGPAAIAGLTGRGALFCLERLAWDQRMRVVFRGEHTAGADACVAHRFEGPATLLPTAVRAAASSAWADALADVVATCPSSRRTHDTATALTASARTLPTEPLFSWIIAPVARA